MNYDTILFDLDGTLTDPGLGITNSVMYALKKSGIEETDRTKLYHFIGPPLVDSFMRYYGFTHEEAILAVADYREYFAPKGLFENEVIHGVPEMLGALKEAGYKIILATAKPEQFSRQILEHFDLAKYFDGIFGATMDEKRTRKDEVITWAVAHTPGIGRAVMVGDRDNDIDGAQKNGLDSIGVLFGYGSEDELRTAGATYIAKTVDELRILLGA